MANIHRFVPTQEVVQIPVPAVAVTPPEVKLERTLQNKKNELQRKKDALLSTGVMPDDPNPVVQRGRAKFLKDAQQVIERLEKEIAELEKKMPKTVIQEPAPQAVVEASQNEQASDAMEALEKIVPEIEKIASPRVSPKASSPKVASPKVVALIEKHASELIEKIRTPTGTPMSTYDSNDDVFEDVEPVSSSQDVFEDALSPKEESPKEDVFDVKDFINKKAAEAKANPNEFEKFVEDNSDLSIENAVDDIHFSSAEAKADEAKADEAKVEAKVEAVEVTAEEISTLRTFGNWVFELGRGGMSLVSRTGSWVVEFLKYLGEMMKRFAGNIKITKIIKQIGDALYTLLTVSYGGIKYAITNFSRLVKYLFWGLIGVVGAIEWKKMFKRIKGIFNSPKARDFFMSMGLMVTDLFNDISTSIANYNKTRKNKNEGRAIVEEARRAEMERRYIEEQEKDIRQAEQERKRGKALVKASDYGDDGDVNVFNERARASVRKGKVAPVVVLDDSPPQPPAVVQSTCEAIKREDTCETTKDGAYYCNWMDTRTPQCKKSQRNTTMDAIDAIISKSVLESWNENKILNYINNPKSEIYTHWKMGPKALIAEWSNRPGNLQGTFGKVRVFKKGGNKSRKTQNNNSKNQNNKSRRNRN
jgi:hypothetical protein